MSFDGLSIAEGIRVYATVTGLFCAESQKTEDLSRDGEGLTYCGY